MAGKSKTYYQICRENAGLTQEEACLYLSIAETTTLSKYENGHLKVDQALVKQMIILYRTPRLASWHVRYTMPDLAEYLPDVNEPQSIGDMAFESVLAKEELKKITKEIKEFLQDGFLDESEKAGMRKNGRKFKNIANRLLSAAAYIEKNIAAE